MNKCIVKDKVFHSAASGEEMLHFSFKQSLHRHLSLFLFLSLFLSTQHDSLYLCTVIFHLDVC